jgi:hypothetical protein
MAISVEKLFASAASPHSFDWCLEIFARAYCARPDSPFVRVRQRLGLGYSVLVSVPGNCMSLAAQYIEHDVQSGDNWQHFGEYSGGFQSYEQMWQNTNRALTDLRRWFNRDQTIAARHIYHNLNLLSDDRGNLIIQSWAQQAFFALMESTRKGVVLGLTDRDAVELPTALSNLFNEKVRLADIPLEDFRQIIPIELSENIFDCGDIPDGVDWLLWSRLRSIDPIRAVSIMQDASKFGSLDAMMERITILSQSVEFISPERLFVDKVGAYPSGFGKKLCEQLIRNVIRPYQQWQNYVETGSESGTSKVFKRLPPGLILYGPPGTGKTYLARWIARSIALPLRTVKGADLRAGEWGQAEKNVHRLFAEVRRAAPCVLVMDDADDIVPDREKTSGSVASAERAVVNAALQELEGVFGTLEGVLVIMTTNRFDAIDAAIRARLPLHFSIGYPPDKEQLREIVLQIAQQYAIELDCLDSGQPNSILERLVNRFWDPIKTGTEIKARSEAMEGYFSTREILNAMRLLCPLGESCPGEQDLEEMLRYYDGN